MSSLVPVSGSIPTASREDKIEQWIQETGIHMAKANERPWGSYELALSTDGQKFVMTGDVYGYGFTLPHATTETLTKLAVNGTNEQFKQWLGNERLEQLQEFINE